jgi:hypothetical protein
MASKLVNHISFQVKKLIVGLSSSRNAPKDAPVTTNTVPDYEMLFGTPMQMESTIDKNEDAISCVGVAIQMESHVWLANAAVKKRTH